MAAMDGSYGCDMDPLTNEPMAGASGYPQSYPLWGPNSEKLAIFRPAWVGWEISISGLGPMITERPWANIG